MPSPTYVALAKTVLTGTQVTITFDSIPNTYTDLVLLMSARKDNTNTLLRVRFNSDSTALYSETVLRGDGSAASSLATNASNQWSPIVNISTDTSNTFTSTELYIPNYAGSANKVGSRTDVVENNATAAPMRASGQLYRSTSAISRIDIDSTTGNFVSGSRFDLYGIKNS